MNESKSATQRQSKPHGAFYNWGFFSVFCLSLDIIRSILQIFLRDGQVSI